MHSRWADLGFTRLSPALPTVSPQCRLSLSLSPSPTVTRSLQRRLSPWPCGLVNPLEHATILLLLPPRVLLPSLPCTPPPESLLPLPLSLSLSPLDTRITGMASLFMPEAPIRRLSCQIDALALSADVIHALAQALPTSRVSQRCDDLALPRRHLKNITSNSRHVSRLLCEDVPIFREEFDECKFLFRIQIIPHMSNLWKDHPGRVEWSC
jgi:hypothetical protein